MAVFPRAVDMGGSMPSNASMRKPVHFAEVVEAVLSGACTVEDGESASVFYDGGSTVSVILHRDFPGVVALYGDMDGEDFLTGAFSSRLRSFLAQHHAARFRFDSCPSGREAISRLFRILVTRSAWERESPHFRFVCGGDGVQLLSELKRVSASAEDFH